MKLSTTIFFLLALASPLFAKKFVPCMVFTLAGDTLTGKISIPGKPCNLSNKALYRLGISIEFKDAKDQLFTYRPGEIKGFAILCGKEVAYQFISLKLSETVTSFNLGYAGMFGLKDEMDIVFAEVMEENGFVKRYKFTGYSTGFSAGGGPSGNIYTLQLLKKTTDEKAIIFSSRPKEQREQLIEYLGDCPKVKAVLEIKEFKVKANLLLILNDYNLWYNNTQKAN
jgi:hypothetical protein